MIKDDFDFINESFDEQELLYEISRLQERLDRMESEEAPFDRNLADELDRISDELNSMKKERRTDAHSDSFQSHAKSECNIVNNTEKVDAILQKVEEMPSQEDLNKAILALRKSSQILENSSGEKVAEELVSLKAVLEASPQVERPVAKKDEIFTIKQFSDIKKLLGGFDDRYEKYLTDNAVLVDSLAEVERTVSSPSMPFVEKLFAMLNLYNLLSDNKPEKAVIDSFNNMVIAFFEQNLSAEKLEKIFYLSEVSSLYKITDENRAKAKKFYALYDEVLAVRPSKQLDVIEKIYELKVDLCGDDEKDSNTIEKLRSVCGKNSSTEEIKMLLNELMTLPINCIVTPPTLSLSHAFEPVVPNVTFSDAIKKIADQISGMAQKIFAPVEQVVEHKQTDVNLSGLGEQLSQIQQKISAFNESNNAAGNKEEIISAIGALREEIAEINIKLEKISEYDDEDAESYVIEAGSEIEDVEEIDLTDTTSEKVDQLLEAVGTISADIRKITSSEQEQIAESYAEPQKDVLSEFTEFFRGYMEQFKGEVCETLTTLRADFNGLREEVNSIKQEVFAIKENVISSSGKLDDVNTVVVSIKDCCSVQASPVAAPVVDQAEDVDKLAPIDKTVKEVKTAIKTMAEQIKTIKKDVESVKERNQRIYSIYRQVEAIKNKVDSLHRAGIAEKEANIIKQLKTLQTSVDKLLTSAVDKKEVATSVKKSTKSEKVEYDYLDKDDVAQSIDSLKKELSAIMKLVNDEK